MPPRDAPDSAAPAPDVRAPSAAPSARRARVRRTNTASDPLWPRALAHAERYLAGCELEPTPVQRTAFEALASRDDALFVAPTGSGKTLAAVLPLLGRLREAPRPEPRGVRLLYIAPVRALVAQQGAVLAAVARAVSHGLDAHAALSVGVRTGDSSREERAALARTPPDALLVTPESLAVLLAARGREALASVTDVVLDEVHALAAGKRGALLAATLETLGLCVERAGNPRPRRVGLSATAHPVDALARWLGGHRGPARALVHDAAAPPRAELLAPVLDAPYPSSGWAGRRMLPAVARAVAEREGTTLVFVPSRVRAEQWTQALRDVLPPRMAVGCFHGSMAADERGLVALKLARGELRVVVATSSLEVGVDVPDAEQVLLLSAPATVTQLVQSAGRSQHRPGGAPYARIAPASAPELVTAVAALRLAQRRALEPVVPRAMDLDVALQAVLGLCAAGPVAPDEIGRVLRRAAPFAALEDETVGELVEYLATGGDALAAYDDARRIALAGDDGYVLSGPRSQRAYVRGVGTIVDEPSVLVRAAGRAIGRLDGRFAALLEVGDRFALAGATWRVLARTPEALDVAADREANGPVARWTGARVAQSEEVTEECEELYGALDAAVPPEASRDEGARAEASARVAELLGVDAGNARAVVELVRAQRAGSALPTPRRFVVELVREGRHAHLVAHTLAGANANEVIGRVVAARWRTLTGGGGADVVTGDAAVAVTVSGASSAGLMDADEALLRELLDPSGLERELDATLEGSALAKAHFRDVARVAQLAVSSGRPGDASPNLLYDVLRKHAPGHVLLRALSRTLWGALDGARAARVLTAAQRKRWHVARLRGSPSALAVPLFALGRHDRVAPEDLEGALVAAAHALYLRAGGGELP